MSAELFRAVAPPEVVIGEVQSLNGIYSQKITTDYTQTISDMQRALIAESDQVILAHFVPLITPVLLRAGWTPPKEKP